MTEDTTPRRVEQMDLSQPFWLTFDQTDAKRYTVPHPTEQEARQYAQERAVATGRQIAVFGPRRTSTPSSRALRRLWSCCSRSPLCRAARWRCPP